MVVLQYPLADFKELWVGCLWWDKWIWSTAAFKWITTQNNTLGRVGRFGYSLFFDFFPLLPYIIILLLCLWNYCFMLYLSACLLYDKLNNHHIKITSNYMHLLFYGTKEMSINGFHSTSAFIVAYIFLPINHYMWAITLFSGNHYNYIGVKQLSLSNACVISNCGVACTPLIAELRRQRQRDLC